MSILSVKNLTKTFDKLDIKTKKLSKIGIWDLNFEAQTGKIFGLLGANGAGKTTTLRILAGLMKPDQGEIYLGSENYSKITNLHKKISLISGETQIYDRLTCREILTSFARLADFSDSQTNGKIQELSQVFEMESFLDTPIESFSTGMRQKISIARGLITDPEVILFDEITNGLDILVSRKVKNYILELAKKGKIIIFSTHIMPDADELCDQIAIINQGKLLENTSKDSLKKKYQTNNLEEIFFQVIQK